MAESTGKSPHALVYGQELALPVDHALGSQHPNVGAEQAATRAVAWAQLARSAIFRAQQQ